MINIFKITLLLLVSISTINADILTNIFTNTQHNNNVVSLLKDNYTFNDYINTHKMPVSLYAIKNHPEQLKNILFFYNDLHKPFDGYSNILNYAIHKDFDLDTLNTIFDLSIKNNYFDINKIDSTLSNTLFYLNDNKKLTHLLKKVLFYQGTNINIIINNEDILEKTLKTHCNNYKLYLDHFDLSNFKYLKVVINNNYLSHKNKNIIISDILNKILFKYKNINTNDLIRVLDNTNVDANIHKQIALFYKYIQNNTLSKIKNPYILKTYIKYNHFKASKLEDLINKSTFKDVKQITKDYNVFNSLNNKKNHVKEYNNILIFKLDSLIFEKDKLGLSPINYAVKNNLTKASLYILDGLPDLNIVDNHYLRTPLHYAVLNNNIKLVNKLIKLNLNPNRKDFFNKTALEYAIINKNYPIIKSLIKMKSLNINNIFINGNPLLIHTILNKLETVSLILIYNRNTNVFVKDKTFKQGALIHSIRNHLENVTKVLLKRTNNMNIIDLNKNTLFDYLIKFQNKPLFLLLKGKHTNFNRKTKNGQLPIFKLIKNKNTLLHEFLNINIDIHIKDPIFNKSTLWWSINYDNFEAFKMLISIEPNLINNKDTIKILITKFKFFKYALDNNFLSNNSEELTIFVLKNQPDFFKYLLNHFKYSPTEKNNILSFILNNKLTNVLKYILENSFINEKEQALSILGNMDFKSNLFSWPLQHKFKLYFYKYKTGLSPLFYYIKTKDYEKVKMIIKEYPFSSSYQNFTNEIDNVLHTIEDDEIFDFFYNISNFSTKKNIFNFKLLEKQILTTVNKSINKTESSLFFEYCFSHQFKKCIENIVNKNILDSVDILNMSKNTYIPHLLDVSLKNNNLFKGKTKPLVEFLLQVNNYFSFIEIINNTKILTKINSKNKLLIISKNLSNNNIKIFTHLLSDINYFSLKNEIIYEIIYSKNPNKISFLKIFFKTFPNFVEDKYNDFISNSLKKGEIDIALLLIKNNFNINKKNHQNEYPIILSMKYFDNKELMTIFFKNPPLDTIIKNIPFLNYLIKKNKYKFIKLILNGDSKFDLFTPKIINNIIKENNHYLIKLLIEHNFDFSKKDYLTNSIKLADSSSFSYIFNSIPLKRLLNTKYTHTFNNGKKIQYNFLENYLIHNHSINNSKDILNKIFKAQSFNSNNLFFKFKSIFKNSPNLETITTILNSFSDKKSIIINQELIRLSLINNMSFDIYSYLLSQIGSINEINPYSFSKKNNTTLPISLSMNSNEELLNILTTLKLSDLKKHSSSNFNIFTNLIKNNSFLTIKKLLKKGLHPNTHNISSAKLLNNKASSYIINHDKIDPFSRQIFRLINNNFITLFFSILFFILLFKTSQYIIRKRQHKALDYVNSLKIDTSMNIENLKEIVLNFETDKQKGDKPLDSHDFKFYQEYKYYLALLDAIDNLEKRAWAKNSNINLDFLTGDSSDLKISHDDLDLLLNEISQESDTIGLQDSSSIEDIEKLEIHNNNKEDLK